MNPTRSYGLLLIFVLTALAISLGAVRVAHGAPLTASDTYCLAHADVCKRGSLSLIQVKGSTDNQGYILEANPTTGGLPVTGTVTFSPLAKSDLARYSYGGGTVTTAAYTTLIASTAGSIKKIWIFDSSGSAIIIATGAAASEVDQVYVPPGGSPQAFDLGIAAGTRVAIKALDVNASTGQMIFTALQ